MIARICVLLAMLLWNAGVSSASAPKVAMTVPDNGEIDVAQDIKEIRVEFDQPMNPAGRSVIGGGEMFPHIGRDMKWLNDRTFVMPVTLEPDHIYQLSINSDTFKGFAGKNGQPADWYPIRFRTRAQGAAPAEADVTAQQNQAALAALKKAIDEDYAYRDRNKVDWAEESEKRRAKFESARSANEFARLAAHLLRLAEDGHVSVQAGDVRIFTSPNSTPPNFNLKTLQRSVPGWSRRDSGIISGRFDDGIGYLLFSECSQAQADDFDQALDEQKDTRALILDARLNGGGDEEAARKVAGRFVATTSVYSKDRLRQHGRWEGPFDRTVTTRADRDRYAKPVVVLIGPKIVSSAESFVLMMKHGADAKLIGQPTHGSSGRPMPHQLGNGVTVYLSSWEDQLPDSIVLEGRGVRPDVIIKTTPAGLEKSDLVLEAALKLLRSKSAGSSRSQPVNR
jgi:hypothetical protein